MVELLAVEHAALESGLSRPAPQSSIAARPVALLVAASLNLARRLAEEQGWRQIALDRYDGLAGHEVRAVADRSTGFIGHPMGTPVYLHSSWQLRDDWRDIEARMQRGDLVRHALPVLPKRR